MAASPCRVASTKTARLGRQGRQEALALGRDEGQATPAGRGRLRGRVAGAPDGVDPVDVLPLRRRHLDAVALLQRVHPAERTAVGQRPAVDDADPRLAGQDGVATMSRAGQQVTRRRSLDDDLLEPQRRHLEERDRAAGRDVTAQRSRLRDELLAELVVQVQLGPRLLEPAHGEQLQQAQPASSASTVRRGPARTHVGSRDAARVADGGAPGDRAAGCRRAARATPGPASAPAS